MALKWYTRARRFPQLIGRTPDGTRIPGGPYTYTQVAAGVVTAVLLARTTRVWAQGDLIVNAVLFAALCFGAVFLTGKLPPGMRNPLVMLLGALNLFTSGYQVDGHRLRTPTTKPVTGTAPVLIYQTTTPIPKPALVAAAVSAPSTMPEPARRQRRRPRPGGDGRLQPRPALSNVQRLLLEKT